MTDKEPLRLVVLGDSTSFIDHRGPQMPTEPALYPNVARAILAEELLRPVEVTIIAQPGTDTRDTWRAVTKDQHVMFDVLMGAHAVVLGIGSFDHAPAGVPDTLELLAKRIRPPRARRLARRAVRVAQPIGVRLSRARFTRVPRREFARNYDRIMLQVRSLARGAACVALGPTSHRSPFYGNAHPVHPDRCALHEEIAERHGVPLIQSWPMVEPFVDDLNPDGIHWPHDAHAAVGSALALALLDQFTGVTPPPSPPLWGRSAPG